MTRVCCYCDKVIGECCGNCGRPAPEPLPGDPRVPGDPVTFRCPQCGKVWTATSEHVTHGICFACMQLTQAERDAMAEKKQAARSQESEGGTNRSTADCQPPTANCKLRTAD